jgi:hypothetical protein
MFAGQTVDDSSLLLRYTYSGDANIDGTIDTIDFNLLAGNFAGASGFWNDGDFNYDASVDTVDFNLLAGNFGQTVAFAAQSPAAAPIPEPFSIVNIGLAGFGLRRRRHRLVDCVHGCTHNRNA